MRSINYVMLLGNLGKDPEIRYTSSDTAICTLALATNHPRKVDGEWEERTEWHRVVVWGKDAERLNELAHKGSRFWVEGEIKTRRWEDNSGTTRYSTEVHARRCDVVEPRERQEGGAEKRDRRDEEVTTGRGQESPEYKQWLREQEQKKEKPQNQGRGSSSSSRDEDDYQRYAHRDDDDEIPF